MNIEQRQWLEGKGWEVFKAGSLSGSEQLVLVFGDREAVENTHRFEEIKAMYPTAHVLMCSSAGEILDTRVSEGTLSLTAVAFDRTTLAFAQTAIAGAADSEVKGAEVAAKLPKENLVHVMIFSDGLLVNGTALVAGLVKNLPATVAITGGLVGDGANFKQTALGLDAPASSGNIVIVGFYGNSLRVGHGSLGGWDPFGPDRLITKSKNNVLYELDNQPALTLYKEYLGDEAKDLPSSGLLFPLRLKVTEDGAETEVVRTLLAVDEDAQSMTFAGDMPTGAYASLMKANFDRLVEGAKGAAVMTHAGLGSEDSELAILISCIGRKLVLKERIEEETEAVRGIIGENAAMAGFYSYGEISPVAATEKQCRLHNQTMTITTFRED